MSRDPQRSGPCPICGQGTVADIAYDVDPASREPAQRADSQEMTVYTCGHRVPGPPLSTADEQRLDVERRKSKETVDTGTSAG